MNVEVMVVPDIKLKIAFVEKHTLVFFIIIGVIVTMLVKMLLGSVKKISRLDSQSKFQMFTLFTGRHIHGGPKSSSNISTNISTLGQRTHLELGELSSLFIFYTTS